MPYSWVVACPSFPPSPFTHPLFSLHTYHNQPPLLLSPPPPQALPLLQQRFPIERARMRLRITVPLRCKEELLELLSGRGGGAGASGQQQGAVVEDTELLGEWVRALGRQQTGGRSDEWLAELGGGNFVAGGCFFPAGGSGLLHACMIVPHC